MNCPQCGAPSDYLYANNGGKGQYQCKVCSCCFSDKNRYSKEAILKCPHCSKALEKIKERKDFDVIKCKNNDCSYYLQKINSMSSKVKKQFKKDPQSFKLRYIFRQFKIDFQPLSKEPPRKPKVDLSRLYVSPHTLGLILTYHVNYGLSVRKTAALIKDVHGVSIFCSSAFNSSIVKQCVFLNAAMIQVGNCTNRAFNTCFILWAAHTCRNNDCIVMAGHFLLR